MAVLPLIIGADQPILRAKTQPVTKVTKKVLKLIKDMTDTMRDAQGVGLAAPQVNCSDRVCIAIVQGKLTALINPDITWKSADTATDEEGCLSLPHVWLPIVRSVDITLAYVDEKGRKQERKLSGFDARVVQHEVDHLDGVLIVDYRKSA